MAELFLAKEPRASRFVVIKRILPYLAEESEFVNMFLDEARIASQLHHPNVIEVYELGDLEGSIFIAMEWVDGVDLRKVLQKEQERGGVVRPGVAAWLTARLCEGLHSAHNATAADGEKLGIIHRDVSPQNLMISFRGEVKLVDFGIAKATAWMSRSKPGVIKGKFLYLAPEQLGQERLDHRADLFAVGTMLYEVTTGKSPFYRSTTEAVIYAIRMEDPVPPHTLVAGYPQSLSRVVMKCLQKDRSKRYQSADEIRAALEDFMRVDAPTTKPDVGRYIAGLYGDDDERTSIYVPPNAQTAASLPPAGGFEDLHEETTRSLPGAPPRQTEGRRQTAEVPLGPRPGADLARGELPTRPARAQGRDSSTTAPLDLAKQRGRDVEATLGGKAPMVVKPPAARSGQYAAAGADEGEATALSSGETSGETSGEQTATARLKDPDEGDAAERTLRGPADDPRRAATRPPPPVASQPVSEPIEDAPWASQVGITVDSVPGVRAPDLTLPAPPPAPKRASPEPPKKEQGAARKTGAAKRGPLPVDPDDYVPTMDLAGPVPITQSGQGPDPAGRQRRLILIGIFLAAGLLMALLLTWALWPTPGPRPRPADPSKGAAPQPSRQVRVQFRAPKGTVITVDGAQVAPGDTRERSPGPMRFVYRCPPKKNVKPQDLQLTMQLPESAADVVSVDVPCK